MKKMRRYADGGDIREGRNENIDDDTRARAMRFVQSGGKREEDEAAPAPKRMAPKRVTDTGDESARMAKRAPAPRNTDIPGEASYTPTPEAKRGRANDSEFMRNVKNTVNALPPMIGGPARAIGRGIGALGSAAARGMQAGKAEAEASRAAAAAKRSGLAEKAREQVQAGRNARRAEEMGLRRDDMMAPEDLAGAAFKKGGKVSRAAGRADGIAKRGHTKGRML